jgi:superfamily I DNA and/or RNA helicase
MDDGERKYLLEMRGNTGKGRLSGPEVAAVLRHYPIWALSNLTVARFVPPELIFDYVVIDEASQCDIASALPLLARARRAVVVGDPAQLGVVSTLSPEWEVELLETLGLSSAPGIGRFRQSRNSLFDLASTVNAASRHLLTDHFRCHADIAAYVEGFYGSQLSVLTEPTQLNPPPGQRPGLFWEDISGTIEEARKG